jgi:hypothetical protein
MDGLTHALAGVTSPTTVKVVLGDTPELPQLGPQCLSLHAGDVQSCTGPLSASRPAFEEAEQTAASDTGSRYINVRPWFCSKVCTSIIGHYEVYAETGHITNEYARYLETVLAGALGLPAKVPLPPVQSDLHTALIAPTEGATLSGTQLLNALAPDTLRITKVEFRITGGNVHDKVLGIATPTLQGWIKSWDTATVPNGRYELQSVAFDSAGKSAISAPLTIDVRN